MQLGAIRNKQYLHARQQCAQRLNDTCTISTITSTYDGIGGQSTSATVTVSVPCMLRPYYPDAEEMPADSIRLRQRMWLDLPHGTAIQGNSTVVVASMSTVTLNVVSIEGPASEQALLNVLVEVL